MLYDKKKRTIDFPLLLESFIFADCRLGSHPKIRASIYWFEGGKLQLYCRSHLNEKVSSFSQYPDLCVSAILSKKGYGRSSYIEGEKNFFWIIIPISAGNDIGVLALESESEKLLKEYNMGIARLLAALIGYFRFRCGYRFNRSTPVSVSLGRAMAQARRDIGISQELLAYKASTSKISLSMWEIGGQPPSPGPLIRWCESLELFSFQCPTIVKVTEITPELLDRLQNDPMQLNQMSPEMFEHFVADRLDHMGFEVKLIGASTQRDGGIDLIAVPKLPYPASILLAGQVKHHSGNQKTGRSAVDRLLSWRNTAFNLGLLVTNTSFTRDALWSARQVQNESFLRLRDFEDLKRWIAGNFWDETEWREIPDIITLAPGIAVKVPKVRLETFTSICLPNPMK